MNNIKLILAFAFMLAGMQTAQARTPGNYGSNLLTFSPVSLTDNGIAVGLSYERVLDKKGIVAFTLPVFYSFNSFNNDYNYNYNNPNEDRNSQMLYLYPGIKIYPTGAYGVVRYGIGPSLVIGTGNQYENYSVYDNNGQYIKTVSGLKDRFLFGVMVNNSLNINPSDHLYLGLDFGLGLTYVNNVEGRRNTSVTGLVKMGFSVGFRF